MSRKSGDRSGATQQGWVYTLHFVTPLRHAKHYTGFAIDVSRRINEHRTGNYGEYRCKIMDALRARGGSFVLVSMEKGTRDREITLKQRGASRRCPICTGKAELVTRS